MNTYSNYSEKKLLNLLAQGDANALSSLYYLHVKQLNYFVLRTAKSSALAEDVVHDTFIKVWENREKIDCEQQFKPYLYTIARRHLLNLLKRAQHEVNIMEEIKKSTVSEENATELLIDYTESSSIFMEAINSLPVQRKEVFIRCRIQGLTYKQAAEELGVSESTVNNQMVKALKTIRGFIVMRTAVLVLLAAVTK
ncbi:RNA polymerase sigma factor [Pedobacter nyackensis]|uniref:RNA polymerase sigma-70 factor, ECF subfamily n=1 Tax=Pedobacter nyackensis TaxID=475255 RepID=A0A1W2ENB5_9SPHI|nr:RNA polymerase sigma-70 factor [Pedobacter nyackensis]SMD11220.1 RNA polymerase sigma-70 factor, ECF subfamily [Pedobacter nyackensis]